MLTPEMWAEWKTHPTTVDWFKFLAALKEELKDDWCNSVYVGQGDYETIQRNSYAIGQAKLLEALMEATVEDATEKIYESTHKS